MGLLSFTFLEHEDSYVYPLVVFISFTTTGIFALALCAMLTFDFDGERRSASPVIDYCAESSVLRCPPPPLISFGVTHHVFVNLRKTCSHTRVNISIIFIVVCKTTMTRRCGCDPRYANFLRAMRFLRGFRNKTRRSVTFIDGDRFGIIFSEHLHSQDNLSKWAFDSWQTSWQSAVWPIRLWWKWRTVHCLNRLL